MSDISVCEIYKLGLIEYESAWQLQERLADEIGRGLRPPALLLLEHPHTFTFGRKGHAENLLWDEAECRRRGVSVHWVDRGGDVTYHGPGQLVGYPLLPLRSSPGAEIDYVGYVRRLERMLITALKELGTEARQEEGLTGVWVDQPRLAKIAAIGVKVDSRGVSRHGFALNVAPDMSYWGGIIGCGLADYAVTSLAELNPPPPAMPSVQEAVCHAFEHEYQVFVKVQSPDILTEYILRI